jgi:hypothetical protein
MKLVDKTSGQRTVVVGKQRIEQTDKNLITYRYTSYGYRLTICKSSRSKPSCLKCMKQWQWINWLQGTSWRKKIDSPTEPRTTEPTVEILNPKWTQPRMDPIPNGLTTNGLNHMDSTANGLNPEGNPERTQPRMDSITAGTQPRMDSIPKRTQPWIPLNLVGHNFLLKPFALYRKQYTKL